MPIDPTPPGAGIMTATPEDQKLPQPQEAGRDQPEAAPHTAPHTALRSRPQIPARSRSTAADVEDADADPVIDTGPGITDGPDTPVHP